MGDLRKHGVKVSLGLGGWSDSLGDKYSRMVNSPDSRTKFVGNALDFVEEHGFDGLDLDWEYPVCWQVSYPNYVEMFKYLEDSANYLRNTFQ